MPTRSYKQQCSLAQALDIVGERWALLIVRDLLLGPLRYKDLLGGLPGIGTNLLADRLRSMARAGILESVTLPPPAGASAYQLTKIGRGLEPAIRALAFWGGRLMADVSKDDHASPSWAVLGMAFMADDQAARDSNDCYAFRFGADHYYIRITNGVVQAQRGDAQAPDVVFDLSIDVLRALQRGERRLADARGAGLISVTGSTAAVKRCAKILHLPWLVPSAGGG